MDDISYEILSRGYYFMEDNILWYKKIRLIQSLKKFIFRYQDLVELYSVSAEKIISEAFSYSENV